MPEEIVDIKTRVITTKNLLYKDYYALSGTRGKVSLQHNQKIKAMLSKKGGKDEPTFEIVEKPMEEKRLIHVKILKNGSLVYYAKGYNEVIISNIEIDSTKD